MFKELTVKGEKREVVIGSLLRRGICKLEQNSVMDNLANKIFSSLWDKIESSIQSEQGEDGSLFSSLQDWRCLQGTRAFRLQNDGCPIPNSVPNLEYISSSPSSTFESQIANYSGGSVSPAGVNRTPPIPIDVRGHRFGLQSNTSLSSSSNNSETWDQACCDQPLPNLSLGSQDISHATTELLNITSGTQIANELASQCAPVCVNIGEQGSSGSVAQVEEYSNGSRLQPPERPSDAYDSMLEGASQSLDGPENEGTAHQPSACGFENYEPVAWVPDQLYNQDHGCPQNASIPCQTSVRGFDNYDAESVAWGS
ncbi:hypothetical protein PENNAL_c0174G06527, partial [Penicillium nalgiovense]